MGGCLSNLYLDILDSADAARKEPEAIIGDDDLFAAVVRGPITPTQFIAQEVTAIQQLTPDVFIDADLATLRDSYTAGDMPLGTEESAEIERIIETRRHDPNLMELSILMSSAFRHGHAQATLVRVAGLWSEHALPHVDRSVMQHLHTIINTTLPFTNGVIGEIDDETRAAFQKLNPQDLDI